MAKLDDLSEHTIACCERLVEMLNADIKRENPDFHVLGGDFKYSDAGSRFRDFNSISFRQSVQFSEESIIKAAKSLANEVVWQRKSLVSIVERPTWFVVSIDISWNRKSAAFYPRAEVDIQDTDIRCPDDSCWVSVGLALGNKAPPQILKKAA